MEPTTAVTAGLSIYQAGGFALLLLAIVVVGAFFMGRFFFKLTADLGARLNAVQDQQIGLLVGVVKDSTAANRDLREEIAKQTAVIAQQTEALRGRPCLIETGAHRRPGLPVTGAALAVLVLLCGCMQTQGERQADTEKRDSFTVEGDAAVPMPQGGTALVPVRFTVERVGSERLVEHSESKTQIDAAAIAQQVGSVVGKSIDAALAKLTGLHVSPPASNAFGITPTEGTLAGTLGGIALIAGREYMARRRLVRQRDELHQQNVELAKQIPPPPRGDA